MGITMRRLARGVLPDAVRSGVSRELARSEFTRFMNAACGDRYRYRAPGEVPASEIVIKTNAKERAHFEPQMLNRSYGTNVYLSTGYSALRLLLQSAVANGLEMSAVRTVFDFGCGDGRLIRHLAGVSGLRLVGSDTRSEAVEWCRRTLAPASFHINEFDPPLRFLDDGEVDLAYAYSVFTHIPVAKQAAWIDELSRVVAPGGYLLVTVMSDSLKGCLPPDRRAELAARGEVEVRPGDAGAHLATSVGGSPMDVYQTPDRVVDAFSRRFRVLAYLRDVRTRRPKSGEIRGLGQDLVVLKNGPTA